MTETLMDMPKIKLENMKDIEDFVDMSKTKFATYFASLVKDELKIIGKEQDVYYFDSKTKLWTCVTKEVYVSAMAVYFDEIGDQLRKAFDKFSDEINKAGGYNNKNIQEDLKRIRLELSHKRNELDSTAYINTIIDRSCGLLQDNVFATKLNSMHDYLPIKNGKKVSLITGKVSDRTKQGLFSFESPVEVVKDTPNANKFFSQIMPDKEEREYLRKVLGYMLTGNMDARCFFIFYGDGSNGKTIVMQLLEVILLNLYHQASKGIFMKGSKEKTEGASPDKVALIGVRSAVYSEGETADDIDINESFLKMVSGKDKINARSLFRAPLTFYPCCKLTLLTNYKPELNGDKSIIQRIRYLFFKSSFVDEPDKRRVDEFKKDDDFIEQLKTEYLSEVFSWILKGSIEYYKDKKLKPPQTVQDQTDKIFKQQDSITAFLKNKVTITNNQKHYIKKSAIVTIYQAYCNENSLRCQPRSTLFKRLEDCKLEIKTLNGYEVYRGISLIVNKAMEDMDDDDEVKKEDDPYEEGVNKTNQSIQIIEDGDMDDDDDNIFFGIKVSKFYFFPAVDNKSEDRPKEDEKPKKINKNVYFKEDTKLPELTTKNVTFF